MAKQEPDSTKNLGDVDGAWDEPDAGSEPGADAAAPVSTPTLDSLDAGWLDELFEGDEAEDDDDESPDESGALPDETLDPIAYAEAKRARELRADARREKRRAKSEAKRARQKARADAARGKQKKQKAKPRTRKAVREATAGAAEPDAATSSARALAEDAEDDTTDGEGLPARATKANAKAQLRSGASGGDKGPPWKLIALALAIFLSAAALAAVLMR